MSLTSKQDKLLRQLGTRQGRKKQPFFICEGSKCCLEAVQRRPELLEFAVCEESFADDSLLQALPVAAARVTPSEFTGYAQTDSPQGILLVLKRPAPAPLRAGEGCTLVLDRIADPGNMGTILRTAWAVGMEAVIWTAGCCDPFGAKAIRAGMGAQFAVDLPRIMDLDDLAGQLPQHRVWITDAEGETSCFDSAFDLRRSLLVMGNEGSGAGLLEGADRVRIPMPGSAESLNVAQAATVLLFEALRMGNL